MNYPTDKTLPEPSLATVLEPGQVHGWKGIHTASWAMSLGRVAFFFVIFLALILIVQRTAGAPSAAFGSFPDEPAHYIGGLVSHDYFLHIFDTDPISFARDYYVRIPYFALGVWPPFFYELAGGWMWLFGMGRESVLWLIAISGAALATLLAVLLARRHGFWMAMNAGAILLLVPVVQWSACIVMVDITCSFFALVAIVLFARFLERQRWQALCRLCYLASAPPM